MRNGIHEERSAQIVDLFKEDRKHIAAKGGEQDRSFAAVRFFCRARFGLKIRPSIRPARRFGVPTAADAINQ